jgi:hypothetical protein
MLVLLLRVGERFESAVESGVDSLFGSAKNRGETVRASRDVLHNVLGCLSEAGAGARYRLDTEARFDRPAFCQPFLSTRR